MSKNNPRENETQKKCQATQHSGSVWGARLNECRRGLYDTKHCIFHSEDIERKKKKIKGDFWEEFERQEKKGDFYDFSNFIFPDSIDFVGKKFEKDVSFKGVKFFGDTSFRGVKFYGDTFFNEAQFLGEKNDFTDAQFSENNTGFNSTKFDGDTYFTNAKFLGFSDFNGAQFLRNASFGRTQFSTDTEFNGAQFLRNVTFYEAQFKKKAEFWETQFLGSTNFDKVQFLGSTNFDKAQFSANASFYRTQFLGNTNNFYNCYFKNIWFLFDSLKYRGISRIWKSKYKISNFRFKFGEESAERHPVIDRMRKDAWYLADFQKQHLFAYKIWNISSKCGQRISYWIGWSFLFATFFAVKFYLIYLSFPSLFHFNPAIKSHSIWSFIYYSFVTFTTLGFGDIIPTTDCVQGWVIAEVVLGYIMLGGLISIFANILARRS